MTRHFYTLAMCAGRPSDPYRSRDAVTRAWPQGEAFARAFGTQADNSGNAYVNWAGPADPAPGCQACMFAPGLGVPQDPATGCGRPLLAAEAR